MEIGLLKDEQSGVKDRLEGLVLHPGYEASRAAAQDRARVLGAIGAPWQPGKDYLELICDR